MARLQAMTTPDGEVYKHGQKFVVMDEFFSGGLLTMSPVSRHWIGNGMAKVLLVEDETNIRKLVSVNLSARGFEVVEAEDAETGLEILKTDEVEVLILDIMLPGMDGWTLLETLAAIPTAIRYRLSFFPAQS